MSIISFFSVSAITTALVGTILAIIDGSSLYISVASEYWLPGISPEGVDLIKFGIIFLTTFVAVVSTRHDFLKDKHRNQVQNAFEFAETRMKNSSWLMKHYLHEPESPSSSFIIDDHNDETALTILDVINSERTVVKQKIMQEVCSIICCSLKREGLIKDFSDDSLRMSLFVNLKGAGFDEVFIWTTTCVKTWDNCYLDLVFEKGEGLAGNVWVRNRARFLELYPWIQKFYPPLWKHIPTAYSLGAVRNIFSGPVFCRDIGKVIAVITIDSKIPGFLPKCTGVDEIIHQSLKPFYDFIRPYIKNELLEWESWRKPATICSTTGGVK